ncbi:uncharacterized protein L203_106397 [Cryptococcus depauperatus CBS 7841]|uniref:Uncharacterized protein n=1 Tax=Cryptococcus depauperatus CBS 7841 TaxID=1295531 RepID=A0A1E3IJI4_9TREE|nr:hypothetical protein L203_02601 [Cryptococcus depauperatus CBS 7841]
MEARGRGYAFKASKGDELLAMLKEAVGWTKPLRVIPKIQVKSETRQKVTTHLPKLFSSSVLQLPTESTVRHPPCEDPSSWLSPFASPFQANEHLVTPPGSPMEPMSAYLPLHPTICPNQMLTTNPSFTYYDPVLALSLEVDEGFQVDWKHGVSVQRVFF